MKPKAIALTFILAAAGSATRAEDPATEPSPLTPRDERIQLHLRLAKLHEKAAACLKADRSLEDCRNELLQQCPVGVLLDECKSIDVSELQRHKRTHQQAGTMGKSLDQP